MPVPRRPNGAVVLTALLVSLTLASCRFGGSDISEANRINQNACADIKEIERTARENKDKESEFTRARNAADYDAARRIIDDSIKALDHSLASGQSAADKFARALKLDIDPTIKEYLSFRAQAANKAIDAFNELRKGLTTLRESIGSQDRATNDKAQNEYQQGSTRFEELMSEAQKLESQGE